VGNSLTNLADSTGETACCAKAHRNAIEMKGIKNAARM
jgi:hypothetical protein